MIERELLGSPIGLGVGALDSAGHRIVKCAPAATYAIITDQTVGELALLASVEADLRAAAPGSRVMTHRIPPGESHKTRATWSGLSDWILSEGGGRDTTIVALGGGVVGDLAGFVAATFMRGIPVVQLPTTLVAMVDAAIGGKTGVDTPLGKNLIGAFHRPSLVLIDPSALRTLPRAHVRAGLAEVLKHGAIADAAYFRSSARHAAKLATASPNVAATWWQSSDGCDLILRSVEIKSAIVATDEKESGRRESLNFGHTVAHALEAMSAFTMLHGHAVGLGMIAEAALGESLGVTTSGTAGTITEALHAAHLPTVLNARWSEDQIIDAMRSDKKARHGQIRCAIPAALGTMLEDSHSWSIAAPPDALRAALRSITQNDTSQPEDR